MSATRTVVYQDEEYNVEIIVRRATVLDGMRRSSRIVANVRDGDEEKEGEKQEPPDASMVFLRLYMYPNCLGSAREISNRPQEDGQDPARSLDIDELSFEDFLELPEQMVSMWHQAAIELNPHWIVKVPESPEALEGEESEPDSEIGSDESSLSGSSAAKKGSTPPELKTTTKTTAGNSISPK